MSTIEVVVSALTTRPLPLPVDDEMMQQQADELVGGEIIAAAIHAADAVGVAIGDEAKVVRMLLEKRRAAPVVLLDRLRVDAAEQRVVLRRSAS